MQARERCHDSSTMVVLYKQEKMIKTGRFLLVAMYHPLDDSKSSSSTQALIRHRRRRRGEIAKVRRPRQAQAAGRLGTRREDNGQAKKLSQVRREPEQSKSDQMDADNTATLPGASYQQRSSRRHVADRTAMLGSTL